MPALQPDFAYYRRLTKLYVGFAAVCFAMGFGTLLPRFDVNHALRTRLFLQVRQNLQYMLGTCTN